MKNGSGKSNIFLKLILWILAIASVAVVAGIAFWSYEIKPVTGIEDEYTVKVRVPSGMSSRQVADKLEEEKLIRSRYVFYAACKFRLFDHDQSFNLKSGVYTIKSSMTMHEIYTHLQSGEQEYISVSIPEGLTKSRIGELLETKGVCSKNDFLVSCRSKDIISRHNIPSDSLEGFLFPDTYYFTPEMEAEKVVEKMVENFFTRISSIEAFNSISSEEVYYFVRLASIVEREYRVPEEAPLIASVFSNRLRRTIGLYSCATIEYIITEIQGKPHPERITYKDLKIESPYNTYIHAGLPPTPISNPGMIALDAAINPAKTKYYFFVLNDAEKGTHTFSRDFDEHVAANNTYAVKKSSK